MSTLFMSNRVRHTSRMLQAASTAGLVLIICPLLLGLILGEYQVQRLVLFFRYDRSWLARLTGAEGRMLLEAALGLGVIPWIVGLCACRRIFKSVVQGEPYESKALRAFRTLAMAWFLAFPVSVLLSYFPKRSVVALVPTLLFHQGPRILYLVAGVAFLVLAWLMDEAARLQAEQDLVV